MEEIAKVFCDLVSIPSPSGSELNTARYIKKYLEKMGLEPYFDNTGKYNQSNSGNLIVKIKGSGKRLLFVAHMDTVEDGDVGVKPIVDGETVRSDGNTILGADNKAGVAALLCALKLASKKKERNGIIAVFSTREEKGVMGVGYLKLRREVDFGFIIDGSGIPGGFVDKTIGYLLFSIDIYGKAAHAAVDPEKGINAVKTAGEILSKLKIGRDRYGNTMNIGTISGGQRVNVVPDHVVMNGEIRSYVEKQMHGKLAETEKIVKRICKKHKAKYRIRIDRKELMAPFVSKNKKIINYARKASEKAGTEFSVSTISGTTEANVLAAKGYDLLGISRGGELPHSKEESIKIKDMKTLSKVLLALMDTGS